MAPPHVTRHETPLAGLPYHDKIGFRPPHGRRTKKQELLQAQHQANPVRSRLTDEARWKRMTGEKWAPMKTKIEQLYSHEKLSLRLVMDIMWCIYQFGVKGRGQYLDRLKKWGLCKNYPVAKSNNARQEGDKNIDDGNAGPTGKQTRSQRNPKLSLETQKAVILPDEFDLHFHMNAPSPSESSLRSNRYRPHERVLISVHRFIHGIFGSRDEKWSAIVTGFLDANGRQCPITKMWRTLPDRCHSASILIRCQVNSKAETTLQQMLDELRRICHLNHPAFIVYFWRLCLRIHGLDSHLPGMRPLDRLFALLLECWPEQSSYIGLLIHSLREVSPEELRYVLRIGYVKAIRTLTDVIGDENLMVLEMVSFYCRYFSAKFILKQALIAKLQCVWHQIYDTSTTGSQPTSDDSVGKIAIDYTYAYAAYYVCDSPYLALGMLEKLRTATLPYLTESLTWTAEIEAFSFASTVMAQIYRQYVNVVGSVLAASNEFAKCCASMQFAIEKLEAGDRECRTRAAVLSRSLHRWLVEWKQNGQAEEEEVRYRRIRDSIPGKTCRACIRERYCAGCAGALQRGITPGGLGVDGPREGCRRCNPRKFARLCQKCTGRLIGRAEVS